MASPKQLKEAIFAIFNMLDRSAKRPARGKRIETPTLIEKEDAIKRQLDAIEARQATGEVDIGGKTLRGVERADDPDFRPEGYDVNELTTPRVTKERAAVHREVADIEKQDFKAATKGVRNEPPRKRTPAKVQTEAAAIESFDQLPRPLPKDAGAFTHFQELENWDKFLKGKGSITKLRTVGREGTKDPKKTPHPDDIIEINERREEELRKLIEQVTGTKVSTSENVTKLAKDVVEADVADLAAGKIFGKDVEVHPGKLDPEAQRGAKENFSLRQLEDIFPTEATPQGRAVARVRKEASKAAQRSGRTRGPDQPELKIPTKPETFKRRFRPDASKLEPVQEKLTGPLRRDVVVEQGRKEAARELNMLEQRLGRQVQGEQSPVGQLGPEQILNQNELLIEILKQIVRGK